MNEDRSIMISCTTNQPTHWRCLIEAQLKSLVKDENIALCVSNRMDTIEWTSCAIARNDEAA